VTPGPAGPGWTPASPSSAAAPVSAGLGTSAALGTSPTTAGPGQVRSDLGRATPGRWGQVRSAPGRLSGYRRGAGPGRQLGLALARHRRSIGAALALAAIWATVRSASPPAEPQAPVLVAAHDLAAGSTLAPGDLRPATLPRDRVPASAVAAAAGRVLAGPLGGGEVVTTSRLLGPGLLTGLPTGTVAVTLRPADPADLGAVGPGDRIDVLAGPAGDTGADALGGGSTWAGAQKLAASALVLAVPGPADGADGGGGGTTGGGVGAAFGGGATGPVGDGEGGALVVGVDPGTAARLAAARTARPISLVLLARP
jgi:pilus assembly protein CpaB